ncbi:MAG: methionine sulfoxide reductase [Alphaproteobacteria bacterium]|nr:methionine sulfoxide reductase [Alphaproteobacteria bacterium]MDB5723080.1 methionine sulfoxide reductase [Alphaproteobacteria bacterium]
MKKLLPLLAFAILVPAGISLIAPVQAAASIPAPKADIPAAAGLQTAVLAGGCFWGMEGVYEHVKGVRNVVSGYAGGGARDASYDKVSTETTGHAEAVKIVYDPKQISYGQLLRIYFSAAHDPTQVNRQGPDQGPSYRSAIFPQNDAQRKVAQAYIAQLGAARAFPRPIATRIESGGFYPAEAYHQGYMRRNPRAPYILINDVPRVAALKQLFPAVYR